MNFKRSHRNKSFYKRMYRIALILIGIVIVIFNDSLGKREGFVEFLLIYFIVVIVTVLYWLFKQIRSIIQLKNEKSKTELMHLQSQVNPHFFFNMLNNLYGLVDQDSKKAKDLILKLSDLMRYGIYEGQKETALLSDEIEHLKNYIELHKMRYHKAIDIQFNIDANDNDYEIMPLLFIILLENAFKHGVESLRTDAYVHINLVAHNKDIYFEIENNFDTKQDSQESGIGLKNLKGRLELVYPKRHSLTFSQSDYIFNAKLKIKNL